MYAAFLAVTFGAVVMVEPARVSVPVKGAVGRRAESVSGLEHRIYGRVVAADATSLRLRTRLGAIVLVDRRDATSFVKLTVDRPIIVVGRYLPDGSLQARAILHTFPDAAYWPADT